MVKEYKTFIKKKNIHDYKLLEVNQYERSKLYTQLNWMFTKKKKHIHYNAIYLKFNYIIIRSGK